jgi:hypothetical protein
MPQMRFAGAALIVPQEAACLSALDAIRQARSGKNAKRIGG